MSIQKWSNLEANPITLFDNTVAGTTGGQDGLGSLPNNYRKRTTYDDGVPDIIVNGLVENANGYTHAFLELFLQAGASGSTPFAGTPNNGGYFAMYALPTLDGTNFTDHDIYGTSIPMGHEYLIGSFTVRNGNVAQRVQIPYAIIPPSSAYFVIENKTGVNLQPTGGGANQIGAGTICRMKRYTLNVV